MKAFAAAALVAALSPLAVVAADCAMSPAFRQPDGNAPGRVTPVWADAAGEALLFVDGLNVNTDGTRRSYSVADFWGKERALNNLCNAMSDACAGLGSDALRERRLATQRAAAAGWPAAQLRATRIAPAIIPFKGGKPCPEVDGFLVSATSLRKPGGGDVCDISRYVDALVAPALVLPRDAGAPSGFTARNARIGDLAVAMVPGSAKPVFAVVGDTGPARQLGEASVALNGLLLGKTAPPKNYDEVRGRAPFAGQGWTVPKAAVLIFPATRDTADPFMTPDRIDAAAKQRFDRWAASSGCKPAPWRTGGETGARF